MARTLYRIYLYVILSLLLLFVAGATAYLLGTLLQATPLNGPNAQQETTGTQLVYPVTFAIIAWFVGAIVGGLHYWLMRRDIAADPGAGVGPVRALFLNGLEAVAALVTLIAITVALGMLSQPQGGFSAIPFGIAFAFGALFAAVELERRRSLAAPGGAIVLQRLHFFGMQLVVLLFFLGFAWTNAIRNTVFAILIGTGQIANACANSFDQFGNTTGPNGPCYSDTLGGSYPQNLAILWLSAAVLSSVWLLYGLLAPDDTKSRLRLVLHFLGFAVGLTYALVALGRAAELVLRAALGLGPQASDVIGGLDFISPAIFGAVVITVYALWLARDAAQGELSPRAIGLTVQAVTAGVMAFPFYIGCAYLLTNIVESNVPDGTQPTKDMWAAAGALVITGVGYIAVAILLRRRTATEDIKAPRRGFVLALLALGTLTGVIAAVVILYALITNALGSPLPNWQQTARQGAVDLVIAVVIVGIYVQAGLSEGYLARRAGGTKPAGTATPAPAGAPAPAIPPPPTSIETVLDALVAGAITRDAAAARIRELTAPAG
jgi:hypothetical protein